MPNRKALIDVVHAEFTVSWPKWRGEDLEPLPQVCFCGRSNVGKSSLLNCLVNRKALARTSRTPGRTQALNVFLVHMRRGEEIRPLYFVDLPGYGYADAPKSVRAQWAPMMQSFLKNNPRLRGACVLFDIRREPNEQDIATLDLFGEAAVPLVPVATKADKVGKTQLSRHLRIISDTIGIEKEAFRPFSALTRAGRDELLADIFDLAAPE